MKQERGQRTQTTVLCHIAILCTDIVMRVSFDLRKEELCEAHRVTKPSFSESACAHELIILKVHRQFPDIPDKQPQA